MHRTAKINKNRPVHIKLHIESKQMLKKPLAQNNWGKKRKHKDLKSGLESGLGW